MAMEDQAVPRERVEAVLFGFRRLLVISTLTSAAALLSAVGAVVAITNSGIETRYFTVDAQGRMTPVVPLAKPMLTNRAVSSYVTNALSETFTFDYVNFRRQFARNARYFTEEAFGSLKQELERKGLMKDVVERQLVVTATVGSAPIIRHQGVLPDGQVYAWELEFPLTLTFQSRTVNAPKTYVARVLVERTDLATNPEGIIITRPQLLDSRRGA
jgi:intracellular multiplication protein IcmL